MAELKKIRIQNKYDTYENWMSSTKGLLAGEIAICSIPAQQTATGLTAPAIGIKVGEDGKKTFAELPWIQATAGDVAAWAKAGVKPTYSATEIQGLEDFIAGEIQDTNTLYDFSYANDTLTIKSYASGTSPEDGEVVAALTIDVSTKINKVANAVAGDVATMAADGQVADSGVKLADLAVKSEVESTYAKQSDFTTAKEALEADISEAEGLISGNTEEINKIKQQLTNMGESNSTAFAGKADKVAGAVAGNVASLNAEGNLVDGGVAISALAKAADVEANYLSKTDFTTAKEALESSISAVENTVDGHGTKITTLEGQVATLNGEGEGSVKKAAEDAAAAAVNAFATEVTENGKIEKFAELVNWVAEHGTEASEMAAAIDANADAIEALQSDISEIENSAYAGITAEKIAAWDAAESNAKQHANEVVATEKGLREAADKALADRATALETKVGDADSGLIKGVADNAKAIEALQSDISEIEGSAYAGITAAKISAWDKAVEDLATEVSERRAADGELTSLTTTAKGNLVAAINEVKAEAGVNAGNIATNAAAIEQLQSDVSAVTITANSAVQSISGVTATKTGTDVKVTAVPSNLLVDGEEVLVLYCGTASEVF